MDTQEARRIALEELDRWGLTDEGWTFHFDNAVKRAGVCKYRSKRIQLSEPLTELWPEADVRDTILHEIAHALAGHKAGHGPEWRMMARAVGADPSRCYDAARLPKIEGDWKGTCPAGHTFDRHRQPRRVHSCTRCSPNFSRKAIITWSHPEKHMAPDSPWMVEFIQIMSGLQEGTTYQQEVAA